MSIATELTRIQGAKADLKTAIENKGVTVSSSALIDDYPALVDSIPTGGGGAVEEKDVNFIDFDGTLLYSYTLAEAQALTALPDAPDHSSDDIPLVFDRWNYTLEDIQEELEDTGKATVGANYHTADGFIHLVWKVEAGEQVFIYSVSRGATIDWGDGETTTGETSNIYHTYANTGVYECKVSGTSIAFGKSGDGAYYRGIARLYEVRLSQSTRISNNYAFKYCYNLRSVSIPQGVTEITTNMFQSCYNLRGVVIPSSVTRLESTSFGSCYNLRSVSIPQGVTSIPDSTFTACVSLQNITIPHGVTSLEYNMFYNCYNLRSVAIPNSVTSISHDLFTDCYNLRSVSIPQGVTSIANSMFNYCYSLQNITIPHGVTIIDSSAFSYCYNLQSITIPNSVTSIKGSSFRNCYSLQSVTIPDSVTSIEGYAFNGCYFETLVFESTVPPTVGATSSFPSSGITKVVVPRGSLEAYKNATNLSQFADIMVEADE